MQITKNTPITQLEFKGDWRLRKSVANYNATVDKKSRIKDVSDLISKREILIPILGIGPKTYQYLFEYLTAQGLWE